MFNQQCASSERENCVKLIFKQLFSITHFTGKVSIRSFVYFSHLLLKYEGSFIGKSILLSARKKFALVVEGKKKC
jgi:hypothetical protein